LFDCVGIGSAGTAAGLGVAQAVASTGSAQGDGIGTTFTWDLASPLAQILVTSDGAAYVHGLDLVAERRSGAWAYPLGDALGSVRQWTDEDGYVDYAGGYTPFGTEMWREGSTSSNWGFTGEWYDTRAEMLYLRARWYEPGVGRFGQRDVWEGNHLQPQTLHPYVYVQSNAVGFTDPSGRCRCGPEVSEWYRAELDVWKSVLRQRRLQRLPGQLVLSSSCGFGFGVAWFLRAWDFANFAGMAVYKAIDFNYADQPGREGVCPWPRVLRETGEAYTGDYYPDLNIHELEPGDMCCGGSVTLCGRCIHRTELGNFWAGYAGFNSWLNSWEVWGEVYLDTAVLADTYRPWKGEALSLGWRFALEEALFSERSLCGFLSRERVDSMTHVCFRGQDPCTSSLHRGFEHYTEAGAERAIANRGRRTAYWGPDGTWGPPYHEHWGPAARECEAWGGAAGVLQIGRGPVIASVAGEGECT
jgi:RHS repeat-associated protein